MLWTLGVLVALCAGVIARRFVLAVKPPSLGWMSEQWLAEQRAAQLS